MSTILINGLKSEIQHAFEVGKFMTDGRALPKVDFGKPIGFEVTAVDTLGLYPTLVCCDDCVMEHGRQFRRQVQLKMVPGCTHQDAIMKLIAGDSALAREFERVRDVRVSLKTWSVAEVA